MSEVQFSFDALSFLQEVLPEPEEATPTESIISRPTEPKPVEAKDENQTMLQDFARLQADQYDLKSMKKAPPVKSNLIQDYLDNLDMFYKDEQMNEAINSALMEATRPPIGQLSETARTAMFSGSDMQGADLTMRDNAREAQEVFQPMITPVSRGEQPEMADSPAPVDAPSIDARSNEMLEKPKGIMTDPRGNKRPKARPEGLDSVDTEEVFASWVEKATDRIVGLEGFIPEAKIAFKGESFPTIGYGRSDKTVKLGQKMTQAEAREDLKTKLIPAKIKIAKKLFPKFDTFSDNLKIELLQGIFRGDFKAGHQTVKLINKGSWKEASKEFLNHREYLKALNDPNSDRKGIVDRLQSISLAIGAEASN